MDEQTTLYSVIAGLFVGGVAWLGRFFVGRTINRIDELEAAAQHVRDHCTKIESLAETEARLLVSIHDNSEQIKTQIMHMQNRIDHSSDRVDRIFDSAGKPPP